jgi:hypothetical protein
MTPEERAALANAVRPLVGDGTLVVVSSDFQTGGTWAGAVEALKARWCPVFARAGDGAPQGNRELLRLGAAALPDNELPSIGDLPAWMREHVVAAPIQQDLRGLALREEPRRNSDGKR